MLTFFGISKAIRWGRVALVGVTIALVVSVVLGAYKYIQNKDNVIASLVNDNAILESNNSKLKTAIEQQTQTIEQIQEDIRLKDQVIDQVRADFNLSRIQISELQDKLSRHELGYLAISKPALVENIINNAADEMARCYEIASGAPLTTQEVNATRPSEINSECPELANPYYKD